MIGCTKIIDNFKKKHTTMFVFRFLRFITKQDLVEIFDWIGREAE